MEHATRGFLVRVNISQWSARKLDKKATAETRNTNNATSKAGVAVYKSLLAASALEAVRTIAAQARDEHERRTVPWSYKGPGAITVEGYKAYESAMADLRKQYFLAVDTFLARYTAERDAAPADLGSLYNPDDYPSLEDVRAKFGFSVSVEPMPVASDFDRIRGIDTTAMKRDLETRTNATVATANKDAWDRMSSHVEHMIERLKAYKPPTAKGEKTEGKFHDTLVTNIRDFVALIPSLNIASDSELAALGARVERELCAYDPEQLRKNEEARVEVQKKAETVLADVQAIWAARRQKAAA